MTLFHEIVQMRAGATPYTFDGDQTARFNQFAKKLVAIAVSNSLSTVTTDESSGMAIRIASSNWNGFRYFPAGFIANSGPTTNHGVYGAPIDIVALDIDIAPNTTMTVDISNIIGATQTGTHDVTLDFIYDDGNTPQDIIDKMSAARGLVSAKGGTFGYYAALADTAETPLTNNGEATFNIPAEARELIGAVVGYALDSAVTAAEEITGKIRFNFGVPGQGDQFVPLNGGSPGLGTEVEGAAPFLWSFVPMHLQLPPQEIQTRGFVTAYSAIIGGADVAVGLLWR